MKKAGLEKILCVFTLLGALFLTASFGQIAEAATYYVPDNFVTIQSAIDGSVNGDTILVRPGTYYEKINFSGKAVILQSTDGAVSTIIDGGQSGSVVTFNSNEGSGSILDGFTITNGNAYNGGGIYMTYASPTIKNCTIAYNTASERGGGVYANESSPGISACNITNNTGGLGGGIAFTYSGSPSVSDSTIAWNSATSSGGGMVIYYGARPLIYRSTIMENTAGGNGGGVSVASLSEPDFVESFITGNTAGTDGGGIYTVNYGWIDVVHSIIDHNNALRGGGAAIFINGRIILNTSIISDNSAQTGGALYLVSDYASSEILNSTVVNNTAPEGGSFYFGTGIDGWGLNIKSSIVYFNSSPPVFDPSRSTLITCTNFEYGYGNIDVDPLFVDTINGNYHLGDNSPCIDIGCRYSNSSWYDLDGILRPLGSSFDTGAYEYIPDDDGDGYDVLSDCNDNDPTVYPGAPETKHDGIDQDCNGYDLTIDIIKVSYSARKDKLSVEATSSRGQLANLELVGYGLMAWNSKKEKWTITAEPAGGDPGTVEVCGIEGCETASTE